MASCETTDSAATSGAGEAAAVSEEASAPAVKPYRSKKCLVTGEPLDSQGTPITEVYKGQEVKFCCEPCKMAFHMNPGFYMAKL